MQSSQRMPSRLGLDCAVSRIFFLYWFFLRPLTDQKSSSHRTRKLIFSLLSCAGQCHRRCYQCTIKRWQLTTCVHRSSIKKCRVSITYFSPHREGLFWDKYSVCWDAICAHISSSHFCLWRTILCLCFAVKTHVWKKNRESDGKNKKPRRKFHFKQIARWKKSCLSPPNKH